MYSVQGQYPYLRCRARPDSDSCVIAELFTEGGGMFRLADLFKYRELGGDVSKMPELSSRLNAIKDPAIRVCLSHTVGHSTDREY